MLGLALQPAVITVIMHRTIDLVKGTAQELACY